MLKFANDLLKKFRADPRLPLKITSVALCIRLEVFVLSEGSWDITGGPGPPCYGANDALELLTLLPLPFNYWGL